MCGQRRSDAGRCAEYVPKIIAAGGFEGWAGVTAIKVCMSVLEQRFADPALGELVLARDAFGPTFISVAGFRGL